MEILTYSSSNQFKTLIALHLHYNNDEIFVISPWILSNLNEPLLRQAQPTKHQQTEEQTLVNAYITFYN